MTRSGNRRRRVPVYPSTVGTFHPRDHQTQTTEEHESSIRSDLNGDQHNSLDRLLNGRLGRSSDGARNGSDQRYKSNGSDRSSESSNGGLDHRFDASHGGDQSNGGFDRRPAARRLGNERRSHGSGHNQRRSQSRDRSTNQHHHHHYQKRNENFRWEGKEINGQHKDPINGVYMAARAKALKEEGNRLFQQKDYLGAMAQYERALKLTPTDHPERAVYHSNRAACLMQMKPSQFDDAIHECTLALEAHPGFGRALLRRARAYEAIGKPELALQDIQMLLQGDVSHPDALDMAKRIRLSMENQEDEAQQDLQGRPTTPAAVSRSRSFAGLSSATSSPEPSFTSSKSFCYHDERDNGGPSPPPEQINGDNGSLLPPSLSSQQMPPPSILTACQSTADMQSPPPSSNEKFLPQLIQTSSFQQIRKSPGRQMQTPPAPPPTPQGVLTQSREPTMEHPTPPMDSSKTDSLERIIHQDKNQNPQVDTPAAPPSRPVKLIYDHDIRLAEMPINCTFSDLRKLVRSKYPSSKAILIKYKDSEGDLVTITSTKELRLAEAAAAVESAMRNPRGASMLGEDTRQKAAVGLPLLPSASDQLRLHIVEVPVEQEPYDYEDVSTKPPNAAQGSKEEIVRVPEGKAGKEKEYDNWLLEFAHLFRIHLGIEPNGHLDLHDMGMGLCAEALEETITTEEAHKLFEQAGSKFREMVALGYFNWGNVYMCAARKQLPYDGDMEFLDKLQVAFDWAHDQFALAQEKFELSLRIKPDFCDGVLGLGQKEFESAKLHWSLAVATQTDLRAWDSSKTLDLFQSAEMHAQKAVEMVEKIYQECGTNRKDGKSSTFILCSEDSQSEGDNQALHAQQDVDMKSQVYLFWGNVLYEHSQVKFRLGLPSWRELLDAAVQKFQVAGASSLDIMTALERHLSSSSTFLGSKETGVEQHENVFEDSIAEQSDRVKEHVNASRWHETKDSITEQPDRVEEDQESGGDEIKDSISEQPDHVGEDEHEPIH